MRTGKVEIETEKAGNYTVVRLRGYVHVENSPAVRKVLQRLVQKRTPGIVVSLEGTHHMDASGLATLLECSEAMRRHGGKLLVVGLDTQVADAFSLAQLQDSLRIFKTEAEALEGISEQEAGSQGPGRSAGTAEGKDGSAPTAQRSS